MKILQVAVTVVKTIEIPCTMSKRVDSMPKIMVSFVQHPAREK